MGTTTKGISSKATPAPPRKGTPEFVQAQNKAYWSLTAPDQGEVGRVVNGALQGIKAKSTGTTYGYRVDCESKDVEKIKAALTKARLLDESEPGERPFFNIGQYGVEIVPRGLKLPSRYDRPADPGDTFLD